MRIAVEHVVLQDEDDVEEDRHHAKHPLHNVEAVSTERRLIVADGLDDVLQNRESPSGQVEKDVCNRPSISALPLVVKVDLLNDLD